MSLPTAKPFADVRQRRHDEDNGRMAMHGHTARKICQCSYCFQTYVDTELTRTHVAFCRRHDYLDENNEYGTPTRSILAEPYAITALEMKGYDVNHSFQKSNAWEAVPAILAENSVGLPSMRKLASGRVEIQYQLKPVGMLMPDPTVAAAEAKLRTHVYEIKRHRPRLKAIFPTDPPEGVTKPLLKATLKCVGTQVPQAAIVRINDTSAFFDVQRAKGKPLEIDLGASCLINAFSTMARHPSTRLYPRAGYETVQGEMRYVVEDSDYMPDYRHGEKYKGPFWTVRSEEGHYHRGEISHPPAWVSRYELWWRSDGGRKWNALGTFAGNNDECSEVAHTFGATRSAGIVARYLRVIPLEWEGGGAMRVGVYGERLQSSKYDTASIGTRTCEHHGHESQLVRYTLETSATVGPRRHVCDGKGPFGNYKDDYFLTNRREAKRRLREHTAEMLREWHDRDYYDWVDATDREEDAYRYDEVDQLLREWEGGDKSAMAQMDHEEANEQEELELAIALSVSMVPQEHVVAGESSNSDSEDEGDTDSWSCASCMSAEEGWEMVESSADRSTTR